MKIKNILLLAVVVMLTMSFKSDKPAYRIYDKKGKEIKFRKLIRKVGDADVIFFGELHNNPVAHWLQFELTKSLYENNDGKLTLGAEMFEADNQLVIDEYLTGVIRQKDFEKEARLWPNYETDYKALMEFAVDSNLHFVATNIPRRYAAYVNKHGLIKLEELSEQAKQWIAPLPVVFDSTLSSYQQMKAMMSGMGGHGKMNIVEAQAVKDATMAHFIAENLQSGHQFIHFNGSFHSDDFQGIVWYLKNNKPDLEIKTITTIVQGEVGELKEEEEGTADFIIVVDEDMTKTY